MRDYEKQAHLSWERVTYLNFQGNKKALKLYILKLTSDKKRYRSLLDITGWSSRGGQTKNPYWLNGTTCGSSSGSAVVVGANLCLGSLGTETDGSITCPASFAAVFGIKPTVGYTPSQGIIPLAPTQDSVGPIAQTVQDTVEIIKAIAEPILLDSQKEFDSIDPKVTTIFSQLLMRC